MKRLRCPNQQCPRKQSNPQIMIRYGFYRTRWGHRRRFRCTGCGKTFCRTHGTVYHRLQHRRAIFDEVAALSVEGMNKSSIARVKHLAWNTVDRWLERAAASCQRFNHRKITGIAITELQVDEIRAIVGGKEHPTWIFASIDVLSRLWPSTGNHPHRLLDACCLVRGAGRGLGGSGAVLMPVVLPNGNRPSSGFSLFLSSPQPRVALRKPYSR